MLGDIVFRADASIPIGTGHVMRCLALAQALKRRGGQPFFVQAQTTSALEGRLATEGIENFRLNSGPGTMADANETVSIARKLGATFLVADGYHFGTKYQRSIKDAGLHLLMLDDFGHAGCYCADLVVNQNLGASASLYKEREAYTRLILGPKYVLLRKEFREWRDRAREIPASLRKILVTLGGSDPSNFTCTVVKALSTLEDIDVLIVVGGSNPHRATIERTVASLKGSMRIVVEPNNLPELMSLADIAVAAGGATTWELAFMGLPAVICVLAENQRSPANYLAEEGIAILLPDQLPVNGEEIVQAVNFLRDDLLNYHQMSRAGQELVDGRGVDRVLSYVVGSALRLRRVEEKDSSILLEWANDPEIRCRSFATQPITWDSHSKWVTSKLHDPQCCFYIASSGDGVPIGQVRFDSGAQETVISVSVSPLARGRGLGPALIRCGVERFFTDRDARLVHAYIKPDNQRSIDAFRVAGFSEGKKMLAGQDAEHFVFSRGDE